jgi:hypothetical protein
MAWFSTMLVAPRETPATTATAAATAMPTSSASLARRVSRLSGEEKRSRAGVRWCEPARRAGAAGAWGG